MNAELLTIGTEILLGDILNTNVQFLSKELAEIGISVYHHTAVGDNPERIEAAYKLAFERSDIVITTGGLGPTDDDITKEIAAKYFNKDLVIHEESFKKIKELYRNYSMTLTKGTEKEASVLAGSKTLFNKAGLAPGCIVEENGKILIMLPGPPKEAIPMYLNDVKPYLLSKSNYIYKSKTVRISGIGEAEAENMIKDLIASQSNPSIAPYAKQSEMVFRITAKAENSEEADTIIKPTLEEMYKRFGENIYGEDDTTLEECVITLLKEKGLKLACAESCTGGMVCSTLVNHPSASEAFVEGLVTYSNDAKINRLGVKKETLDTYGAVSAEVAAEMAEGVARTSGTHIGISTTGIAGPKNENTDKPVGLVYIGIYINGETKVKKFNLIGNRERIRISATTRLLDALRRELLRW